MVYIQILTNLKIEVDIMIDTIEIMIRTMVMKRMVLDVIVIEEVVGIDVVVGAEVKVLGDEEGEHHQEDTQGKKIEVEIETDTKKEREVQRKIKLWFLMNLVDLKTKIMEIRNSLIRIKRTEIIFIGTIIRANGMIDILKNQHL